MYLKVVMLWPVFLTLTWNANGQESPVTTTTRAPSKDRWDKLDDLLNNLNSCGLSMGSSVIGYLLEELRTIQDQLYELQHTVEADQAKIATRTQLEVLDAAKKAVFRGYLAGPDVTANSPIHWEVLSQIGDHYDATLGVYTVPYNGYYTIFFQMYHRVQGHFNLDLRVNNDIVARARCDYTGAFTCGSGLTTRLLAGDRVWLQSDSPGPYYSAAFDDIFSIALVVPYI